MTLRIARVGSWLYGGSVDTPVDVVALDYDFWYELGKANGDLEPEEVPQPLNSDGWLYYVRFRHALDSSEPTWPDSRGFLSAEDAMAYADAKVEGGVAWDDAVAT